MDDPQKSKDYVAAPQKGYALSGKIMLSAIVVLFSVVVFMVGLHLYARWYLLRARRRELERRRRRRASRSQVLVLADGRRVQAPVADRGLDVSVLHSLPVSYYSVKVDQPPAECAVCLSEFEEKEVVRLLPKCSHSFHIECIDMWFQSHSTCPLCRSPVEKVAFKPSPEKANSSESDCNPPPLPPPPPPPSGGVRKDTELVGVSIEVPPRVMLENELSQSSPGGRLSALRSILSMGRRSPASGGSNTPRGAGAGAGAGTSRVAAESDLESGLSESSCGDHGHVQTRA